MMYYRFPFLLIICISYLGFASNDRLAKIQLAGSETPIIHSLEANAQNPLSIQQQSVYDQQMRVGYDATEKRNYQKALEAFQKALTERPNNTYAQKALRNIQTYLAQNNNSSNTNANNSFNLFGSNSIWLIIGLSFLTLAVLGAFISFITLLNKGAKSRKIHPHKTQDLYSQEDDQNNQFYSPFFNKSTDDNKFQHNSNSNQDFSLPVQPTTRIPSLDLIDELIKTLREPESKARRKAIWKIAQVSDSRAMKPLVDLMIETDSHERSLILEALSQVCTRTLRPMNQALAISLQDKNSQVRKNAIRDLTRMYDLMSQINELLCYALDDESPEVQETAKWALEKLNLRMPIRLNLGNKNQDEETIFEEDIDEEDNEK